MIGAHVESSNPLGEAERVGADCVQIFLGNPQSWKKPSPRADAGDLKASKIPIYVHAPYLINVASPESRIRIPSRKILQETCDAANDIQAAGVIVHAGHASDSVEDGFERWAKALEYVKTPMKILIENTAGGDNAMARKFDTLAGLWERIGGLDVGFCFDTCHAHAAGEELSNAIDRVKTITGRIDLLHANDSRDVFGCGRDRHANIGAGMIPPDELKDMIRACDCPVICETPTDAIAQDIVLIREMR